MRLGEIGDWRELPTVGDGVRRRLLEGTPARRGCLHLILVWRGYHQAGCPGVPGHRSFQDDANEDDDDDDNNVHASICVRSMANSFPPQDLSCAG